MIIVRSVVFPLRINAASAAFVWIFFFRIDTRGNRLTLYSSSRRMVVRYICSVDKELIGLTFSLAS